MSKDSFGSRVGSIVLKAAGALAFVAGGFIFYRFRRKILSFVQNQNFIITAAYAVIIAFIGLFFRLIGVLNWILQQGH